MDASVLERLPWSVQKELIEGLPGGRGQQEQGPGLPAAEQLAARFASGAGGEGGSRAAAAAPCAAPGRHRRQLSNDEEEWEPDWAPASPSEEQAEQQQQQQQQQQRDGASGSGRGDAGSPIVALPAFSQVHALHRWCGHCRGEWPLVCMLDLAGSPHAFQGGRIQQYSSIAAQ